jgi:sulfonate transport system substrate-binding protein
MPARTRIGLIASAGIAAVMLAGCAEGEGSANTTTDGSAQTVRLDYAYWNPLSLVVRDQQCLEQAGYTTEWVYSAGSNKANENLNAEAIDIGSTAGVAALTARANGAAIHTIGVFSQPEWTALVVPAGSDISGVADLQGKRVAATKGTDPYFFLLQSLNEAGLSASDVEIINLQHADGQAALSRGDVDAWAGLDPIMATTELNDGAKLAYRNVDFNSYGVLNAREDFLTESPQTVDAVLGCYEQARQWIIDNPQAAAELLAAEASLDPQVAAKVLGERTTVDLSLVPGDDQQAVLAAIIPVLVAEGQVPSQDAVDSALASLYDPTFAQAATR